MAALAEVEDWKHGGTVYSWAIIQRIEEQTDLFAISIFDQVEQTHRIGACVDENNVTVFGHGFCFRKISDTWLDGEVSAWKLSNSVRLISIFKDYISNQALYPIMCEECPAVYEDNRSRKTERRWVIRVSNVVSGYALYIPLTKPTSSNGSKVPEQYVLWKDENTSAEKKERWWPYLRLGSIFGCPTIKNPTIMSQRYKINLSFLKEEIPNVYNK